MIQLDDVFSLNNDYHRTGILTLSYGISRSVYDTMNTVDFFTMLPMIPRKRLDYSSPFLLGDLYNRRSTLSFIIDPVVDPIYYFEQLNYHRWADLENDLFNISPSFPFSKKNGTTLDEYLDYYKALTKGKSLDEILSPLTAINKTIDFDSFLEHFHLINEQSGHYVLPYDSLDTFPELKALFSKELTEFPCYCFINHVNNIEAMVFYKNEKFYFYGLSANNHTFEMFDKKEVIGFSSFFDAFFSNTKGDSLASLTKLNTSSIQAELKSNFNSLSYTTPFQDDMSKLRNYFREIYDVKAKSKEELWNRGVKEIKSDLPSFKHPMFFNIHHPFHPFSSFNESIKEQLDSEEIFKSFDLYVKLCLLSERGIIFDGKDNFSIHYEKILAQNRSISTLPAFDQEALKSPTFEELVQSNKK